MFEELLGNRRRHARGERDDVAVKVWSEGPRGRDDIRLASLNSELH